MHVAIRSETSADGAVIREVNAAAFATDAEARLVDALRAHGALVLSIVAESELGVIGHLAFSRVTVTRDADGAIAAGIGLAPMAVHPAHQRLGVGTKLVVEGLLRLRIEGHRFCVVLGHRGYYPRFGFIPASRFQIRWQQANEALMVQELHPGGLTGVSGVVRYGPEFDGL